MRKEQWHHWRLNCKIFVSISYYDIHRASGTFYPSKIIISRRTGRYLCFSASSEARCLTSCATSCHPKDKSFADLVEGHFEQKPIIIAERFHFHKRNQAAGESVAQFIAELRRLARHCDLKTFVNKALRDRLVVV